MTQLTPRGCVLNVNTWGNTNVDFVRIAYIIGDVAAIWASPDDGYRVPDLLGAYAWVKRQPSGATVTTTTSVPAAFVQAGTSSAIGFTGYDID